MTDQYRQSEAASALQAALNVCTRRRRGYSNMPPVYPMPDGTTCPPYDVKITRDRVPAANIRSSYYGPLSTGADGKGGGISSVAARRNRRKE